MTNAETNCDYCHEDIDGYVKPLEKNCHVYIRPYSINGAILRVNVRRWDKSIKINFCPMCGRKLTD